MSSPDSFYLYLSSLASSELYPSNSNSRFTNKLATPVNLVGDYSVGLIKSYTNPIINTPLLENSLPIEIKIIFKYFSKGIEIGRETVNFKNSEKIGSYTYLQIITHLEKLIRNFLVSEKLIIDGSKPLFKKLRDRIRFMKIAPRNATGFNFEFIQIEWDPSKYTRSLLNLPTSESIVYNIDDGYLSSELEIFNHNIQFFAVYCDIVDGTRFGDTVANILDVIPIKNSERQHLIYKRLKYNFFESVSIDIRNQFGGVVSFDNGGSTTCLLHFKRL